MSTEVTIQAMRECAQALGAGDHREVLVAIQRAQDALDAAKAHHLGQLVETRGFELDGASSVVSWARDHLRLESHQTKQYVRADATMRALPAVAEVAVAGGMRLEHLNLFGYGLRHVGAEIINVTQDWLLKVATEHEPARLREAVKEIREAVYPDDLDEAWIKGMDKQDIQVTPVPEGFSIAATPLLRWLHCPRVSRLRHGREAPGRARLAVGTA